PDMTTASAQSRFPASNPVHTILALAASLVVGVATVLQVWNATESIIESVVIALGVAVFAGALFRLALDGSSLAGRQRQRVGARESGTAGLQALARGSADIVVALPTAVWSKIPARSATLVRAANIPDADSAPMEREAEHCALAA